MMCQTLPWNHPTAVMVIIHRALTKSLFRFAHHLELSSEFTVVAAKSLQW
jgi:hypothetical protein